MLLCFWADPGWSAQKQHNRPTPDPNKINYVKKHRFRVGHLGRRVRCARVAARGVSFYDWNIDLGLALGVPSG